MTPRGSESPLDYIGKHARHFARFTMGEFEQASSNPSSLSVRRISRALSIRSDRRDASQLVRSTCGVPRRTMRQVRCQVLDVRENTLNVCIGLVR